MAESSDLGKILGENICVCRIRRNMTQEELARKTGITNVEISKIENGRSWPKKETLEKLIRALEMKPFQLLVESADDLAQYRNFIEDTVTGFVSRALGNQEETGRNGTFGVRHVRTGKKQPGSSIDKTKAD